MSDKIEDYKIEFEDLNIPQGMNLKKGNGILSFNAFLSPIIERNKKIVFIKKIPSFLLGLILLYWVLLFFSLFFYADLFKLIFGILINNSKIALFIFSFVAIFHIIFSFLEDSKSFFSQITIDSNGIDFASKDSELKSFFIDINNIENVTNYVKHVDKYSYTNIIVISCKLSMGNIYKEEIIKQFEINLNCCNTQSDFIVSYLMEEIDNIFNSSQIVIKDEEELEDEYEENEEENLDEEDIIKNRLKVHNIAIIEDSDINFSFERKFDFSGYLRKLFFFVGAVFLPFVVYFWNIESINPPSDRPYWLIPCGILSVLFLIVLIDDLRTQYSNRNIKVFINKNECKIEEFFFVQKTEVYNIKELNFDIFEDSNSATFKFFCIRVKDENKNLSFKLLKCLSSKEANYILDKIDNFCDY